MLVIGHGRRLAALKIGCEMPYHRIDKAADELTDKDIRELRIADNQTNAETGLDFDTLNIEIEDLDFDGFDFDFSDPFDGENGGSNTENDIEEKTDVKYFEDEEIQAAIVEGWRTYSTIEEFAQTLIDKPSAMYQFNRLCQGYNEGYNISMLFNPHRIDIGTKNNNGKSIFDGFNNNPTFRRDFARYIVKVHDSVKTRAEYTKLIGIGIAGYQYVNEFQPYLARDIYKRYVHEGDKVLNPCAGWGGRLIGFASCMFNNVEYVETDPATKTYQGLVKIKNFLKLGENIKQYNLPFEDLEVQENYFDFVFTSPPYFDTERYSDEETQSYKRNATYQAWIDGFLKPMVDKILYCMKKSGKCLLNVGANRYSIDADLEKYLDEKGITYKRLNDFKIGGSGIGARTGDGGEPFILFSK